MATRLEELLERQRKLELQIAEERKKAEAEKALAGILAELAQGHDLAALEGKVLRVVEGKLVLNGHGNGKPRNGGEKAGRNGNGYVYYLADGRGPFRSVQEALDGMGIPKDKRPQHNRWERLSTDLQGKIIRKVA